MYHIEFSKNVEKTVRKWKKSNSRHLTANDRIVYDVYDDIVNVLVIEIEGHYDDK